MKKAIFFSTAYWGEKSMFVGSHQIAKKLVERGWEVAFIGNPITPFHILGGYTETLCERIKNYINNGVRDCEGKLWSYVPASFIIPRDMFFFRTDFVHENFYKFSCTNLLDILKKNGFEHVDLIYFDNMIYSKLLKEISYKKSIFRIADKNSGFGMWNNQILEAREKELAQNVDLVVYVSKSLRDYAEKLNCDNAMLIENGVDIEKFCSYQLDDDTTYKEISKPKIIYCGSIEKWFDVDLLCYIAGKRPNYLFDIVGNCEKIKNITGKYPNIRLHGRLPYNEVIKKITGAHVGIIPFMVKEYKELIDCVIPLKLFEYMAGGVPVVSTSWTAIKELDSPAMLCVNRDDFLDNLDLAVRSGKNKKYYEYAKKFSWSEKVSQLLKKINLD